MIIIVSWAANHQIKMISEGSCNIEDWTNDAENSALHHSTKLLFKLYLNRKLFFFIVIFHNITLLLFFDQINAALVSIKDFFQKH